MSIENFKFIGILKDKTADSENTYNGVISFNLDSLFIEENSRLTGKLKNSYQLSYLDISIDGIVRKSFNKLCIDAKDHFLTLKVTDKDMLDKFEELLKYKLTGSLDDGKIFVSNSTEEIKKYHELFKEGIITKEEFESKKKQLLDL